MKVTEETVLTDPAGLHMTAGPYFLIYNKAVSEEEEVEPNAWPVFLKVSSSSHPSLCLSLCPFPFTV